MEPNKKIENAAAETAKPAQGQGSNKTLLWILGGCLVYDGYYIRNQNPLIHTYELAPDVKIVMQTYSAEQTGIVMNNQEITFDQFKNIYVSNSRLGLRNVPYIVEISNQQIVKITEQYIP